jgi:predicted N-acetyltransferase YhbS
MKIVAANSATIESILALLNQVFIIDRKKEIGLERRFPFLFDQEQYDNIYTVIDNGEVVSCCVTRPITLISGGQPYRLFLLGFVATHPAYRNQGYSARLLQFVQHHLLHDQKFDGGFLWTGIQSFYSKIGWRDLPEDSIVSIIKKNDVQKSSIATREGLVVDAAFHRLFENEFTFRCSDDAVFTNDIIPATVNKFRSLTFYHKEGIKSYVSIGLQGHIGYLYLLLYESETVLPELMQDLFASFDLEKIMVNVQPHSKVLVDLKSYFQVSVESRKMGMVIQKTGNGSPLNRWFLPFIMRI